MPARVHALLVVRPDGRTPAAFHLKRTLAALHGQTRSVDALTIVLCGADERLREVTEGYPTAEVISAPLKTDYAAALRLVAVDSGAPGSGSDSESDSDTDTDTDQDLAVWLLAQDTAPEADALVLLCGVLESAPSVAIAAPKLVQWDDRGRITSLGVSMTRYGRTIELVDGDLDQGQHDGGEDVLGADVRGLLVRADVWRDLNGLDGSLAGADEGLDLGVRARLAGGRVVLTPAALVAVADDGVAGLPAPQKPGARWRIAYAQRVATLQRRLAYASPVAVPFHWLSLLPLALWRSLGHLLGKHPSRILPEWGAAVVAAVQVVGVARARAGIRRRRMGDRETVPWSRLAPLRVTSTHLRHSLSTADAATTVAGGRTDLHFFGGGGAWIVLAALVASVVAFPALLAAPVLGGGALAPLRATVTQLWADAAYGQRPLGWDTVGAADPFSAVIALLGSFSPLDPSRSIVILWVLALPLAALGGWFAATRVTERPLLRAVGAVGWALAPTFLAALVDGRPTGVIAHLLLPWLMYAAVAAHRSWASAGTASLLLIGVVACAPSLAPGFVVLWIVALALVIVLRAGDGVARIAWLVVPTIVVFAPLAWRAFFDDNLLGLLGDPGVPWAGPQVAADVAGRSLLAAGFPTTDPGGWGALLGSDAPTWWVPLLVAPMAVLALGAPLTRRWLPGIVLLVITSTGLLTAIIAVGVVVTADAAQPIAVWPGAALSLAWIGMLSGALLTLDQLPALRGARMAIAAVVLIALGVTAFPAATASSRGATEITNGPASTLPAYVDAEGRGSLRTATMVLLPLSSGAMSSTIVWGGSETLGGQTTLLSARDSVAVPDETTAHLTADLVTDAATTVIEDLAAHGVAFVLLAPAPSDESAAARAERLGAETSLDQREGLESVGETATGTLWRVVTTVQNRAAPSAAEREATRNVVTLQLLALGVALLLAIPTSGSAADARRLPRVIGSKPRAIRPRGGRG